MCSRCLFCTSDLGRNTLIESFPVRRRLAFDGAKGRRWVVCCKCERWNLTPLEERWAAIEVAERMYRGARTRVATDQAGLALFTDDHGRFELERIGKPLRPEFAAWRYGSHFGRRRQRFVLGMAGGVALGWAMGGAMIAVGPAIELLGGALSPLISIYGPLSTAWELNRLMYVPAASDGRSLLVRRKHARTARLESAEDGFQLVLRAMREAVALLDEHPDPDRLFEWVADDAVDRWNVTLRFGALGELQSLPSTMRLALEMSSHEETERRAMEGELALLEAAWKSAEEIAAIADTL